MGVSVGEWLEMADYCLMRLAVAGPVATVEAAGFGAP